MRLWVSPLHALFFAEGGRLKRLSPDRAISLEELGEELKNFSFPKIVVGDGSAAEQAVADDSRAKIFTAPPPEEGYALWSGAKMCLTRWERTPFWWKYGGDPPKCDKIYD